MIESQLVATAPRFAFTRHFRRVMLLGIFSAGVLIGLVVGCHKKSSRVQVSSGSPTAAVALDLEFVEGVAAPLAVIAGESYSIDSITISSEVHGTETEVVDRLQTVSFFAGADWTGLEIERVQWIPELNGEFQRQTFFQGAEWMHGDHSFTLSVVDAGGQMLAGPIELPSTGDWPVLADEAFATRRLGAIAFAHGAAVSGDLTGATFSAEARLQFRNGIPLDRQFVIPMNAASLRLEWNRLPGTVLEVPLAPVAVAASPWGYGFDLEVSPSAPANTVYYVPGETIDFTLAFKDGAGRPLHSPGSLPTYEEFMNGAVDSGLQYFNLFPAIIYYKDKNREGVLLASLTGPMHRLHQTHEPVPTEAFLLQTTQVAADTSRDGFLSLWQILPAAPIIFNGPPVWGTPVSDVMSFTLPPDAQAGRYEFAIKARRVYRGEQSLITRIVPIHVSSLAIADDLRKTPELVGNCEQCHTGAFDLANTLHYNGSVESCTTCHFPLGFETNNLLPHRIHRIHYLSERYKEDPRDCTVCHLNPSIYVENQARWLVCVGCHRPVDMPGLDPNMTMLMDNHVNYAGDTNSCSDTYCHHANTYYIHILDRQNALTPQQILKP